MRLKRFMTAALLLLGLMNATGVQAQESQVIQWKGNDYSTLLSGSGTEVFLYNVGTGRFLVHGGDWGTQARLFSEDNGKTLTLKYGVDGNNIIFDTGMNTSYEGASNSNLGCNVPLVTTKHNWTNSDDETFTVLMDAQEKLIEGTGSGTNRNWNFVRVSGTDADVYTYYMYEEIAGTKYYMGAAYGMNSGNHDGDPNGELVLLSSSFDKVTWTTAAPETDTKYTCGLKGAEKAYIDGESVERSMNDNVRIYGGIDVELNKLYQWRVVTKEELIALISSADADESGTAVNLTYLIEDRGFERNDFGFFDATDGWKAKPFTDNIYTTSGEGLYYYTWGYYTGDKNANPTKSLWTEQSPQYTTSYNYKYPVRLKTQYDSKADAKYGFMEFEGVGTASTYIEVPSGAPANSTFRISGYGFYQGANKGYFFASTTDPSNLSISDFESKNGVVTFDLKERTGLSKNSADNVKAAASIFAPANSDYYAEVEIKASPGDKIYFGVAKLDATKSSADYSAGGSTTRYCYITYTSGSTTYYLNHNARFVAVTGDPSSDYQWLLTASGTSNYYYVYYQNSNGTTYYLTASSQSASVSTSTSGRLYYYNGRIVDDTRNNSSTYYLRAVSSNGTTIATSSAPNVSTTNSYRATATMHTETSGGTTYHHDTDWVGADQFTISYMGTDPVMFDEEETSLDYLKDNGADKQYTNQSIRIHRTMVKGQWNSFVFPLDLSASQVRSAFGDNCQLAEISDMGKFSKLPTCIDFEIKTLPNEGEGIEAGKFYLVKPASDPKQTSDGVTYYDCGRASFKTSDFSSIVKKTVFVSQEAKDYANEHQMNQDWLNNVVTTYGTFVNGQAIPAGAYVMGYKKGDSGQNVQVYRITKGTTIQGFRGWIEDGRGTTSSASTLSVGGIYDSRTYVDPSTGIEHVQLQTEPEPNQGIYDMSGRRVGTTGTTTSLPRGLYIVNGKKIFVK